MFKILVVEDDKNSAKLMKVILHNAVFDTCTATNGADAL